MLLEGDVTTDQPVGKQIQNSRDIVSIEPGQQFDDLPVKPNPLPRKQRPHQDGRKNNHDNDGRRGYTGRKVPPFASKDLAVNVLEKRICKKRKKR